MSSAKGTRVILAYLSSGVGVRNALLGASTRSRGKLEIFPIVQEAKVFHVSIDILDIGVIIECSK